MKQTQLKAVQQQVHLHENLKRWMHAAFCIASCLAMALYFARNGALWLKGTLLVLLVLGIAAWVIIGFGVWRSKKDLLGKLV